MKRRMTALATVLLATASAAPVQAHHSFATFDTSKTVSLPCTVREFQWLNPHTWLVVETTDPAGITQEYRFEGAPPAMLVRSGWTQDTLLPGDRISLDYHPLKDGTPGGSYIAVVLSNGKHLSANGAFFFGPNNPEKPEKPPNSTAPPYTSSPIQLD